MIALVLYPSEEGLGFKVSCASPRIRIRSGSSKIMSSLKGLSVGSMHFLRSVINLVMICQCVISWQLSDKFSDNLPA